MAFKKRTSVENNLTTTKGFEMRWRKGRTLSEAQYAGYNPVTKVDKDKGIVCEYDVAGKRSSKRNISGIEDSHVPKMKWMPRRVRNQLIPE